jgi:hypothetical protein
MKVRRDPGRPRTLADHGLATGKAPRIVFADRDRTVAVEHIGVALKECVAAAGRRDALDRVKQMGMELAEALGIERAQIGAGRDHRHDAVLSRVT